jgi:hypothetical protein
MKTLIETQDKPIQVRRYSNHPLVQKKNREARAALANVDLSFLDAPSGKQPDKAADIGAVSR